MKYTSFDEVVLENINLNEVDRVHVLRYKDRATLTLADKYEIKDLLDGFSGVKLKETRISGKEMYSIIIMGAAEYASPTIRSVRISLYDDQMHIRDNSQITRRNDTYTILNDTNYLEILESEELVWELRENRH
ncbi:hypothetical protein [Alkalihalobacterium elongatum]|uniref:hypothetical protein n=1 Tax=Alkalihalobacterium elongatum TaxID=2675466 RepID=UPI001C1F74FB|nr:hypothetical protein [Alkalihalobacterium elongatum]